MLKNNEILLKEGLLTDEIFEKLKIKNKYYYTYDYKIVFIELPKISTKTKGWDYYEQTFEYNRENNVLGYKCSCNSGNLCSHIQPALEKIEEVFGYNIFADNYIEEATLELKNKLGLSENENYQDIYDFKLTIKGLEAISRYKNIQKEATDFTNIFKSEDLETLLDLPISRQIHDYTIGIIFEFYRNDYNNIKVFQGKLNNNKNDISSSLNFIQPEYLNNYINKYPTDEHQKLLYKTLQLKSIESNNKVKIILEDIINGVSIIKELLPIWQNNYIFKYDDKNSFVRKNLVPYQILEKPIRLIFKFSENNYFYTLKAKLVIENK